MPGCVAHQPKVVETCSFCRIFTPPSPRELEAAENWRRMTSKLLARSRPERTLPEGYQTYPSQGEEARVLGELVGSPVGRPNAHAIPKIIHRFWTGGPMSQGALHNLIASSETAARFGWRSVLWYSTTIETMLAKKIGEDKCLIRDTQREVLVRQGYELATVETLAPAGGPGGPPPFTQAQIVKAAQMAASSVLKNQGFDDVKYFSDLSRLMYLYAHGGHHIDVDMGLGTMELSQAYHHNDPAGEVPLLGTLARDSTSTEVVSRLRFLQSARKEGQVLRITYENSLHFLVMQALPGAGMFNALIASKARTQHLLLAILAFFKKVQDMDMLPTGMALQPTLLLGPRVQMRTEEALDRAMAYSIPPYLARLDQITDESDAGAGVKKGSGAIAKK